MELIVSQWREIGLKQDVIVAFGGIFASLIELFM